MALLFALLYVIFALNIPPLLAMVKTWSQNNNWNTVENWQPPRLPCQNDIVNIQMGNTAMLINTDITLKELVLPSSGSIILGDSGKLLFPDESQPSTCKGDEILFTGSELNDWYDPRNWQTTSGPVYPWQTPCHNDVVKFPKDSSFTVTVSQNVSVSRVFVGEKEMNEERFTQYITTEIGLAQIKLGPSVSFKITGKKCTTLSGCTCGNEKVEGYICDLLGSCPDLQCQQTVKPLRACCPICGSIMLLDVTEEFNKVSTDEKLKEYLKNYPSVSYNLVNIKEYVIQVVLEQTSSKSEDLNTVAEHFKKIFIDDKTILQTKVIPEDGEPTTGKRSGSSGKSLKFGLGIGIPVFVIVITMVTITICWMQRNKKRKEKYIAHMDNEEPKMTNNTGDIINPLYEAAIEMENVGKANPLYEPSSPSSENNYEDVDISENNLA